MIELRNRNVIPCTHDHETHDIELEVTSCLFKKCCKKYKKPGKKACKSCPKG